jgi:hypothetical protein
VVRLRNNYTERILLKTVQAGDSLLTLDDRLQPRWTTVAWNRRHLGRFTFLEILTSGTTDPLRVTPGHGIGVQQNRTIKILPARSLKVGDVLIQGASSVSVTAITTLDLNEKFDLVTNSGAVIASSLLVTTISDTSTFASKDAPFFSHLDNWRKDHRDALIHPQEPYLTP